MGSEAGAGCLNEGTGADLYNRKIKLGRQGFIIKPLCNFEISIGGMLKTEKQNALMLKGNKEAGWRNCHKTAEKVAGLLTILHVK